MSQQVQDVITAILIALVLAALSLLAHCGGAVEPSDAGLCECITCSSPAMLPCDGGAE